MRVALSLVLSVFLLFVGPAHLLANPQEQQQEGKPSDSQQSNPAVKPSLAFGLEDGTPVKLRTNRTISSADAHVNDTLDFEVLEEVKVHDIVVIPRGGIAWGTITEAQPKRQMGREGKLNVNIDDVKLSLSDEEGREMLFFTSAEDYTIVRVFEAARRAALNVDGVIDEILGE